MVKVFAYIRVSTLRQGEKGVSLHEQRDALVRYAERYGLTIVRWFEEKETASKRGRPGFNEMLRLLRLGVAQGVVIHKIDRSMRNLEDWADLGKLVDAGVQIHFANEGVDLKTVSGRLSADIQAVIAAHYSRNLSEEAKKGIYGRLKQGFYPLRAPIGYLDQGGGKAKIPDPVRAPLVKQAFELCRTGSYPLLALIEEMKRRGLTNRNGTPVSLNGMATLLRNPFYMGIIRMRRANETYQGNHEPIVSPTTFAEVQEVLDGRAVDRKVTHVFTYSRLARCATCRYSLIGELQKGHVYYRCHNRSFKSPSVCPPTSISETNLEVAVLKRLREIELSDDEVRYLASEIDSHTADLRKQQEELKGACRLQLQNLEHRISKLTDLALDETLDREMFQARHRTLLEERAALTQRLTALEHDTGSVTEHLRNFVERLKSPSLLYQTASGEKKRELLKELLSNLQVSGKKIDVELKIPFRLIAERTRLPVCRGNRGTCRTLESLLKKLYIHFSTNIEWPSSQKA
jgi:DNA invertase Pin-like site-specific DNA recombinase